MNFIHLEEDVAAARTVANVLKLEWPDCSIRRCTGLEDFLQAAHFDHVDLIVANFALSGFSGLDALRLAKRAARGTPFIFVAAQISEQQAIDAQAIGSHACVMLSHPHLLRTTVVGALAEYSDIQASALRDNDYEQVLAQAHDVVVLTDAADRVTFWNARAESLYGWTADQALGRRFVELFPSNGRRTMVAARAKALAYGEWCGHIKITTRTGSQLVVASRQFLLKDESGHCRGRISIDTDLTRENDLEHQLLRYQRTENLGLVAAGLAHDLNNVLGPCFMALPLLRKSAPPELAAKLQALEQGVARGVALIRQMLEFTAGSDSEPEPMQLTGLLKEVSAFILLTFPSRILLGQSFAPGLWSIRADKTQIHQVLLNLCINARDAMLPNGGRLTLEANNCVVSAAQAAKITGGRAGSFVRIEVRDTGSGIDPAIAQRIWEPFFTTKEQGKGTGLGLSTVASIVRAHGGFVCCEPEPERGSRFSIYFPAIGVSGQMLGNGELVMLVGDVKSESALCAETLESFGYHAISAATEAEAAGLLHSLGSDIRLVIADVGLVAGAKLGSEIRRVHANLPLIFVRAGPSGSGSHLAMEGLAHAILPKPVELSELSNVLWRALHPGAEPDRDAAMSDEAGAPLHKAAPG